MGTPRLERGTSCMSSKCSNQLSYVPCGAILPDRPSDAQESARLLETYSGSPLGKFEPSTDGLPQAVVRGSGSNRVPGYVIPERCSV